MKLKPAVICVSSTHAYGTEDEDIVEFSTDGLYGFEGGLGEISYYESEVTGMPGTCTTIRIAPDFVTVSRVGSVTSEMNFREGSKSSFVYDTPYGAAAMDMITHRIGQCFGGIGGELVLEYVIDVEHVAVARNRFTVSVREIKGDMING